MQNFVKDRGRAASPQNGPPAINHTRQAIAANAKVSMKKGAIIQHPQPQSGIPSRGLGNAQNSSAVLQQHPQDRQAGQSQKRDLYDTDAESLDTTVNHSVKQAENNQTEDQQHHQQGHIAHRGEESDADEEISDYEEENDFEDYPFTQEDIDLIQQAGFQDHPHEYQMSFLEHARRPGFQTVEGDSYPSTTNGDPTEWEGGQEPLSENYDDGGPASPSPQRVASHSQLTRPFAPQPLQREQVPNMFGARQAVPKSSSLFHQSAALRNQQRSTTHLTQRGGQSYQKNATAQPAGQPPTYSQANREIAPALPAQKKNHGQINVAPHHAQRQPAGSTHQPQPPSKAPSSAQVRVEPVTQQHSVEQAPIEDIDAIQYHDYDEESLFAMNFDQLKNESFDKNPRVGSPVLTDDILQKPLVERLQFVQKNLDTRKQSEFFCSLRTTEWEDTGDWFLDQFQSIIQRTKEARQSKRKLAREFEDEIEKRHKHVSKKQHQVEEAMNQMKMQGEGLVSKSPRASKSPRPKRG